MNNDQYRQHSGSESSSDPLVHFFYSLLRDHLPSGSVEKIMEDVEAHKGDRIDYTNGFLARYAKDLSERLQSERINKMRDVLQKIGCMKDEDLDRISKKGLRRMALEAFK